jgi:hypothetical protein
LPASWPLRIGKFATLFLDGSTIDITQTNNSDILFSDMTGVTSAFAANADTGG